MEKSKAAARRARQRAQKAAPFPKPRGRAPRGSNGLPQVWDKERGGWSDADPQPAWAWSSTLQLPELDAATTAINTAAAEAVAAATRVAWEAPIFGSSTRASSRRASSRRASPVAGHGCTSACSSRHVAAACTPSSTFHRAGRLDVSRTPRPPVRTRRASGRAAGGRASREPAGRHHGMVAVQRHDMECAYCGQTRHIMPDGRMRPHSVRETMNTAERAAYRASQAYAEHAMDVPW